jgi:hypothetical protein
MNRVSEDAGCKIWRENTARKGLSEAVGSERRATQCPRRVHVRTCDADGGLMKAVLRTPSAAAAL